MMLQYVHTALGLRSHAFSVCHEDVWYGSWDSCELCPQPVVTEGTLMPGLALSHGD